MNEPLRDKLAPKFRAGTVGGTKEDPPGAARIAGGTYEPTGVVGIIGGAAKEPSPGIGPGIGGAMHTLPPGTWAGGGPRGVDAKAAPGGGIAGVSTGPPGAIGTNDPLPGGGMDGVRTGPPGATGTYEPLPGAAIAAGGTYDILAHCAVCIGAEAQAPGVGTGVAGRAGTAVGWEKLANDCSCAIVEA